MTPREEMASKAFLISLIIADIISFLVAPQIGPVATVVLAFNTVYILTEFLFQLMGGQKDG